MMKMIAKLRLLHYLNECTYRMICRSLDLDESSSRIQDNFVVYPDAPLSRAHLFNIAYQQPGHIWFMHVDIDFPMFACSVEDFPEKLYGAYGRLFGPDPMGDFPPYDRLNCDYIEYTADIEINRPVPSIRQLAGPACVPEQLDPALWHKYDKPHSTISFYACQKDATHIFTMANCHGTALKKQIKDTRLHRATGLSPAAALNPETMKMILTRQYQKYFALNQFDILTIDYTSISPC